MVPKLNNSQVFIEDRYLVMGLGESLSDRMENIACDRGGNTNVRKVYDK